MRFPLIYTSSFQEEGRKRGLILCEDHKFFHSLPCSSKNLLIQSWHHLPILCALCILCHLCNLILMILIQIYQKNTFYLNIKNRNHDQNTQEIIAILGGIEQVLTNHLTSSDIKVTTDQLVKLQHTLNSNNLIPSDPKSKIEHDGQLIYTFNRNDTYHHYFFGNKIGSYIVKRTFNKPSLALIAILITIWTSWHNIFGVTDTYYIYKLIAFIIIFLYALFVSLSVNKTVFTRSIQHFVFWFKTIISIAQAIFNFILRYVMLKDRQTTCINIFGDVFLQLAFISFIINYSAIDGHQASKAAKFVFGMILSLLLTYYSVFFSLFVDQDELEKSMVIIGSIQISIIAFHASALRALSIFLWRQTMLIIIQGDKCVNLQYSPKIVWMDESEQMLSIEICS